MKKIAIAAVLAAAASVAAAQVTVGGTVRYDIVDAKGTARATTGITKSEITFTATEDLWQGVVAEVRLGLDGAGRGETVTGTDTFVSIKSPVGTVTVGQFEVVNSILARSQDLAPVIGSEGVVLADNADKNVIQYTTPAVSGFSASISALRDVDSTSKHVYVVGVNGAVGPVDAAIDYTNDTKRVRISSVVDIAGVAVGAGWSGKETGVKDSWSVGAAVPVGAFTVGAVFSRGDGEAREVAVAYNFSQRTTVALAYRDVTKHSTAANNIGTTRVRLQHQF
jgi:predicted porin